MAAILLIIGTRPELIKVAPIVHELNRRGMRGAYAILNTGQHVDLLEPYWSVFDISPDYSLEIMAANQSLASLTSRALTELQRFVTGLDEKPALVLAQGDTTTAMAAAVVSFYNGIPFVHLEAGLRTFDLKNPFPEEFNRRVAAIACSMHLAPTVRARDNIVREGVPEERVKVIGNTVVDAVNYVSCLDVFRSNQFACSLQSRFPGMRKVLITCHRRENHGPGLLSIIAAARQLAKEHEDHLFIWSLHPNPSVKQPVLDAKLDSMPNFLVVPPLDYIDLLRLMSECVVVLSDSGGIQEEAPSFGVPVLVLRERTERPEGIDAGVARLVGAHTGRILEAFRDVARNPPVKVANPYGDGCSAARAVELLRHMVANDDSGTAAPVQDKLDLKGKRAGLA